MGPVGVGDKREDIGVMERFYWLMRQVWWGVVMAVRGLVERWEVAFRKWVGEFVPQSSNFVRNW